jgi:hypothetical protein
MIHDPAMRWVSAVDAAKRLGLSVSGVRHLAREAQLPMELVASGKRAPMRIYRWDDLEALRCARALTRDERRAALGDRVGRPRMLRATLTARPQPVVAKGATHTGQVPAAKRR